MYLSGLYLACKMMDQMQPLLIYGRNLHSHVASNLACGQVQIIERGNASSFGRNTGDQEALSAFLGCSQNDMTTLLLKLCGIDYISNCMF